jgi:radical SAM superfamily enzyme YgiQ (UPF0313 family)
MRIALIAMSGVRVCNPDLMRLGLTLPGFLERSKVIASLPSLSLLTLAGMTPERFDVEYHEIADVREAATLPECDLAAISTFTAQAKDAYALAGRYRELGVPTVMGGLHATVLPDEVLQHCDAVVVGEGELNWLAVLEDFERRRLQRRYEPKGRQFDLADSPMPRFDLATPTKYNRFTVQTQRGCPRRCEFCASSILVSARYKLKPVSRIIDEIRAIKRVWPHPFIEFADDNSFVNRRHARALMDSLAAEDVRWFAETDISIADDRDLLVRMREAGCAQLLIGLESPTAGGVEGIEMNANWKRKRHDDYKAAIERIQSAGIAVIGCFILGLDGDTVDVFDAVSRFVEDSGLYQVQITVLTPFPGTPLYARLLSEGRLLDRDSWERNTLFDVTFEPRHMSVEQLEHGLLDLADRLYSDEASQGRRNAFRRQAKRSIQSTPVRS